MDNNQYSQGNQGDTQIKPCPCKRLKMSETIVNDIVHGIIKLPNYIQAIIDTDQFQRLRYISQLGVSKFVYPTAGYCRFEHSIGTFHLASQLIQQIKQQLENDDTGICVSNIEVKCVEIAALCHDLGHGPYSHFWEYAFNEIIPTSKNREIKPRKHEELSADIFEQLINDKRFNKDAIGLKSENIELIKRIISGKMDETKDKKHFLFEIVANKKSGLDVDKFDYLCRDSIYLGWSNKNKIHDVKRIMHFLRVAQDDRKDWHLAMRDREIFHIHDVFYYRHLLHRYGYQHKTSKLVECLFKKAIKKILDNNAHRGEFIKDVMKNNNPEIENIFFSHEFISKVCDHHLWEIMKKYTEDIVRQIQERNSIKLHCQIQVTRKENIHISSIIKSVKSLDEKIEQIPIIIEKKNILLEKLNEICIDNDINELVTLIEKLKQLSEILENISTPTANQNEQLEGTAGIDSSNCENVTSLKQLSDILENIFISSRYINEELEVNDYSIYKPITEICIQDLSSLENISSSAKNLIKTLKDIDNKPVTYFTKNINEVLKLEKSFNEKLNKLHDIRKSISTIEKELNKKLEGRDDIQNSIHEYLKDIIEKLNQFPDILENISTPAKDLIKKLKHLPDDSNLNKNENIKLLCEPLKDLPDFVIENGNIHDDLNILTDLLKKTFDCIADIAISKFSLQSEDKGNPLLAVRFYKKNEDLKCFNMEEEELPDLVNLKTDEFVLMIFTEVKENDEKILSLDKFIKELCLVYFNEISFDAIEIDPESKAILKDKIKKYKFRKNLY